MKATGKLGEGESEGRVFTDLLQDPEAGFSVGFQGLQERCLQGNTVVTKSFRRQRCGGLSSHKGSVVAQHRC